MRSTLAARARQRKPPYLIATVEDLAAARDLHGLCAFLLATAIPGFEPRAIKAGKRLVFKLVRERALPIAEVARSYIGVPEDAWLCALLAELGDDAVLDRALEIHRDDVEGREVGRRVYALAALGTRQAYDLLRVFRDSADPALASKAEQVLRRFPEGSPVPRLPGQYF